MVCWRDPFATEQAGDQVNRLGHNSGPIDVTV